MFDRAKLHTRHTKKKHYFWINYAFRMFWKMWTTGFSCHTVVVDATCVQCAHRPHIKKREKKEEKYSYMWPDWTIIYNFVFFCYLLNQISLVLCTQFIFLLFHIFLSFIDRKKRKNQFLVYDSIVAFASDHSLIASVILMHILVNRTLNAFWCNHNNEHFVND